MKKSAEQVHYSFNSKPACGISPITTQGGDVLLTKDRHKVTCKKCRHSLAWRGR